MRVAEHMSIGQFDIKAIAEKLGIKDIDKIKDIAQQVKGILRPKKAAAPPTPTYTPPMPTGPFAPVEPSKFPLIPILIAGGGVLILVIVLLMTKKS